MAPPAPVEDAPGPFVHGVAPRSPRSPDGKLVFEEQVLAEWRSAAEQNAAVDLAARRRLRPTRSWGEAQMLAQLEGATWADTNVLLCPAPRGAIEPPDPPLGAWGGEAATGAPPSL